MNEAAQQLCLTNPALLQKSVLMEEARCKIIDEGFQFLKGKSCSKKGNDSSEQPPHHPKRRKLSKDMRDERLREIEDDCKDISVRIDYKEKRIAMYENSRDYKKCDDVKEEITALRHQRRELEAEAKGLRRSNIQSKWNF